MSNLPTHAQVVIIGGGVGGCSIAYHLTLMGWKDVVILERHELTSGSTWHSAGLVGQMRSDANLTRMMHYSTDLYRKLKQETEQDTGWREVGGLRLASSAERMEDLKRLVGMAQSFGVPMDLISPKEAYDLFPIMNMDGVVGAAYTPNDGVIDPTGSDQCPCHRSQTARRTHLHGYERGEDQPEERSQSTTWSPTRAPSRLRSW